MAADTQDNDISTYNNNADAKNTNTSIPHILLRFAQGVLIGIGGIIPGVSGGVLAVMFGIYERFAQAIAHPLKRWREDLPFFLPVILGGAAGIVLFSWVVKFLYESYSVQVVYFFSGCVIGTLPCMFKKANVKGGKPGHWAAFAIALIIMSALSSVWKEQPALQENASLLMLALGGAILGVGTILPGICSSFVLIYLGLFQPILHAVATFEIPGLLFIGLGAAVSIILLARLVNYLFKRFYSYVYFAIIGVVLASIYAIFPGFIGGWEGVISYALFAAGGVGCFFLSRLEK